MDGGAWQATVHGVAESGMTQQLSLNVCVGICHLIFDTISYSSSKEKLATKVTEYMFAFK